MAPKNSTTGCVGNCAQSGSIVLDISVAWVLLCSFMVMFMQCGFAMLEVGSVREAHRMTVLAKNVLDSSVSCMVFWAYVQLTSSRLTFDAEGTMQHHLTTFHCAFCATAVTICSGAMAERTHMGAYLCYAVTMAGLIYPVLADSVWGGSGALLYREFHGRMGGSAYHDFAGGGVVHLTGGCAAMVGNMLVGRRILLPQEEPPKPVGQVTSPQEIPMSAREEEIRFLEGEALAQERTLRPEGGWPRRFDDPSRDSVEFKVCTYLQVMGMFILWVGWYAFNSGSTLAMDHSASIVVGVVAWNTTVSAAAGSFGAYMYCLCFKTHLDAGVLTNGTLAGLVAITAGCDVASSTLALLIGMTAGLLVYPLSSRLWQGMHLDDPVEAVAVHGACGLWGLLSVSFCRPDCSKYSSPGFARQEQFRFCADDHSMMQQFIAQLWGGCVVFVWTLLTSGAVWSLFVLSECTRALEVKHLEDAVGLVLQMVVVDPANSQVTKREPTPEIVGQLQRVVRYSPLARRILKKHGWCDGEFQAGTPTDLWHLRHDLQEARGERAETALEITDAGVLPRLASWLHACPLTRELAILRLRITPAAEISGLGAANTDGGKLLGAIRRALVLLVEARQDQGSWHSPIRREVRELSMTVQSQEVLLEALMRSSRNRVRWRRSLGSVPEQEGAPGDPEHLAGEAARGCGAPEVPLERLPTDVGVSLPGSRSTSEDLNPAEVQPLNSEAMTEAFARLIPRSYSHSSDRTTSDRSAGNLTPRSLAGDTPPPTILGRSMRMLARPPHGQADELVAQLANMLQTHQQLLSALQQVAAPSSGDTTPDSRGSPARGVHHHLHQALQSMSAQMQQQQQQQQQQQPGAGSGSPTPPPATWGAAVSV